MGQCHSAESRLERLCPNKNVVAQYAWLAPSAGTADAPKPEEWRRFGTLAQLRAATGQEAHGTRPTSTSRAPDAAGSVEATRRLSRDRSELSIEAVGQGRRRRRGHSHGQRWVCWPSAGSWCDRGRGAIGARAMGDRTDELAAFLSLIGVKATVWIDGAAWSGGC